MSECPKVKKGRAATAKQAGGFGGRRDEAAANNEDYEGFDEENQIKRKNGR